MKSLSPLRYPGGKSKAVKFLKDLIPKDTKKIISPFFGGGSFELYLANTGIEVIGYDIFLPLVEFWKCLIENPNKLADMVIPFYPLKKEDFYNLQKSFQSLYYKYERAAAFFVLNRSSFSGSTLSGGMSPGHPRFNLSSIEKVRNFKVKNFNVKFKSFEHTMDEDVLIYADPPYMIKSNLYGNKGNTHKNFDHQKLFSILNERNNWILSYNDCEETRKLYSEYKILNPEWKYGMGNDKQSREIVILSKDLGEK